MTKPRVDPRGLPWEVLELSRELPDSWSHYEIENCDGDPIATVSRFMPTCLHNAIPILFAPKMLEILRRLAEEDRGAEMLLRDMDAMYQRVMDGNPFWDGS